MTSTEVESIKGRTRRHPQTARNLVALYDSGLGGLSVLQQCLKLHENTDYIYLADTEYCPLGTKPGGVIRQRVAYALSLFEQIGVKASIIACNTASIHGLKQNTNPDVVGTIDAACQELSSNLEKDHSKVLVLGTSQTIKSNAYQSKFSTLFPTAYISAIAADSFVKLVEENASPERRKSEVEKTLAGMSGKFDACVLACTHFPFIKEQIGAALGLSTVLVDPALRLASQISCSLKKDTLRTDVRPSVTLISTGYRPKIESIEWYQEEPALRFVNLA